MPFSRPTLPDLVDRILADFEARLPEADSRLRRSVLDVLGRTAAGVAHGLYGYLDWIGRQILPDTAEAEILDRHASLWGITRKAAAAAAGPVTLTGTSGAVVPAGALLQRADGIEYATAADAILAAGTATVTVTAALGGVAGNAEAASKLSFVSPIAGVQSTATVAAGDLIGGAAAESDDALLARLLARIREPPHGGAAHDYVVWALEVDGVTRAWCYPRELGAGTVTVRFVMDDAPGGPIPDAGTEAAVQAHIDALRPVTADINVVAPVAVAVDFEIALTPATAQAAVEAGLRDLLAREAEPGGTILLSHIREAISTAAGEADHTLAAPAADVVMATGEIAVFGAVTWS